MPLLRIKALLGGDGSGSEVDGTLPYSIIAAATTNANLVKAGPGVITVIHTINQAAALRYLKFYDMNVLPTAGSGTPVRRYPIPASTTGLGFILQPAIPLKFLAGIAFTITAGQADNDTTALAAGDVTLTLEYN